MNADILKGNWKQAKGKLKEMWGDLTDDEIERTKGDYDQLVGTIQERYGYSREETRSKVNEFLRRVNQPSREV